MTEYREYRTMDKSTWGDGPWSDEPDKAQWADEATGLPCLMVRNHSGALCGYVGVPEGHPLYEIDYAHFDYGDEGAGAQLMNAVHHAAHRGLTYSDRCQPDADEDHGICHVPGEGEPDHVWWLGFDCAHSGDYLPRAGMDEGERLRAAGIHIDMYEQPENYKTFGYVKERCAEMAAVLAGVS